MLFFRFYFRFTFAFTFAFRLFFLVFAFALWRLYFRFYFRCSFSLLSLLLVTLFDNNVAHQQALHFYKMQPQGKVSLLVVTPTRTCSVRIAARLGRIRLCSTDSPWSAAHGQGSPTLLQTWNPARAHVESTPSQHTASR